MDGELTPLERHDQAQREGRAWGVFAHYGPEACAAASRPDPDRPGWRIFSMGDGPPDYWLVASRFDSSHRQGGRYKSEAAARRKADELNRLDVQGPLDPEFAHRRRRLKRLAPDFGGHFHDGPREARYPVRPGKYALDVGGHGWHAEYWWELADDLEAVEAVIREEEQTVVRVVDLDTGQDVPFDVAVTVKIGE